MAKKKKVTAVLGGMVLALAIPAAVFAADGGSQTITSNIGEVEIPVQGNYVGDGSNTLYKVEISWGNMKYNYSTAATEWDTEQHKYVATGTESGGFTPLAGGTSDCITVRNSSNAAVTAAFTFEGATADTTNITANITGGFAASSAGETVADSLILDTAAKDSSGNLIASNNTEATGVATTGNRYLVITDGALAEGTADVPLGTVTVSISSDDSTSAGE